MKLANQVVVLLVFYGLVGACGTPCAWSQAGFKSELTTRLEGGVLGLGPIRAAAQDGGCAIVSANDRELTIKFAGRTNNVATIAPMGNISVRSAREVKSLEDVDQLYADLVNTYNFIAKVSPSIPEEAKFKCLYFNVGFRLSNPKVLKRIVFPIAKYEGTVIVPDCKVKQARFVVLPTPSSTARLKFRDKTPYDRFYRYQAGPESVVVDISGQLVFGRHQFSLEGKEGSVSLEAVTDPTADLIYYQGGGLENVITTAVLPLSGKLPGPAGAAGGASSEEPAVSEGQSEVPDGGTYVIPVDSEKTQELVDKNREASRRVGEPGQAEEGRPRLRADPREERHADRQGRRAQHARGPLDRHVRRQVLQDSGTKPARAGSEEPQARPDGHHRQ